MKILRGPGGVPDAPQRVVLDGRVFRLRWRWLTRARRWALDVSDATGALLAGGLAVVPNEALLAPVRGGRPEMPPGELVVIDLRAHPEPPTLDGLGEEPSRIVYLTAADVAEARAA